MSISLTTQSRTLASSSNVEIVQYIPENCYVEQQLKYLEVSSTGRTIICSASTSYVIDIINEYKQFRTDINFSKVIICPGSTDQEVSVRQVVF